MRSWFWTPSRFLKSLIHRSQLSAAPVIKPLHYLYNSIWPWHLRQSLILETGIAIGIPDWTWPQHLWLVMVFMKSGEFHALMQLLGDLDCITVHLFFHCWVRAHHGKGLSCRWSSPSRNYWAKSLVKAVFDHKNDLFVCFASCFHWREVTLLKLCHEKMKTTKPPPRARPKLRLWVGARPRSRPAPRFCPGSDLHQNILLHLFVIFVSIDLQKIWVHFLKDPMKNFVTSFCKIFVYGIVCQHGATVEGPFNCIHVVGYLFSFAVILAWGCERPRKVFLKRSNIYQPDGVKVNKKQAWLRTYTSH